MASLTDDQASMCLEGVKAWVWIQTAAVVLTLGASVGSEDVALPMLLPEGYRCGLQFLMLIYIMLLGLSRTRSNENELSRFMLLRSLPL